VERSTMLDATNGSDEQANASVGRPNASADGKKTRVLAVASRGGHWVQLMQLRSVLERSEVTFVCTDHSYRSWVGDRPFRCVVEANRHQRFRMLLLLIQIAWILVRVRPHRIVTTGAAPGYFAILFGKWLGAKGMWIDSIANTERLSMSGRLARKHAAQVLTQWPHLADETVRFEGSVI
jgi:hypothetical protein